MIKIHIKRYVPEGKEQELTLLINDLRNSTMGQPGYVSGETLNRVDKPGEKLVVSKWRSLNYWKRWYESEKRTQIQEKIDQLLGEKTQYEVYEYE